MTTAGGGNGRGTSGPPGFAGRRGPDLTVGPIGKTLILSARAEFSGPLRAARAQW